MEYSFVFIFSLHGLALTLNCSYCPVQICGTDTCHVLGRTGGGSGGDNRE